MSHIYQNATVLNVIIGKDGMSYPLPKDPWLAAYLKQQAQKNKDKASKCHICKKQSTGINAYGYQIKYVCDEHLVAGTDVILDTSIPGVIHYIYPNGLKLTKEQLDPNIGNFFDPKDSYKRKQEQLAQEALKQDSFWASQISFEE